MEFAVIVVALLLGLLLRQELRRIEARLAGSEDGSHDEALDEAVRKGTESYRSHLANLEKRKKELPRTAPWEMSGSTNWEEQLVSGAEALRSLAEEAYDTPSPDAFHFMQRALRIPMAFKFAYALATFAELRTDIAIKHAEWGIKKVEVLGLMRKRRASLTEVAEAERDLGEIERETEGLERLLEKRRKDVCDAVFEQIRNTPS